jgi:uncharacterized protein
MANRLAASSSPYLLQHADNPVDWWEWSPAAFEEARRRDVPVLLSVGYAACHWCHVMAHESFEDPAAAEQMNAGFVCVKVDREERPDVDAAYMAATTALTGHGGWPMTAFLTADGRPFYAGTYFPPQPRHGVPSFRQLLTAVSEAWTQRRGEVEGTAGRIADALSRRELPAGEGPPDAAALSSAVEALAAEEDRVHGGFGGAPKFPPSAVCAFLLRHAATDARTAPLARDVAGRTLAAMAASGTYDQVGGGFARYAVDAAWVVPHFEKMLYDNAQLARAYLHWWRLTGEPTGARVALETCDFLLTELRTPEGGLASSLDADTLVDGRGVEGATYVWTPSQLAEVLGPDDGAWAADLLGVTAAGTFEHGTSTLRLRRDPWADPPQAARWRDVRARLRTARARRPQPGLDDKVVAAWNGLAVAALAECGALLGRPDLVAAAERVADLLLTVHLDETGRLRRVSRGGVAGAAAGVLEDYGDVAEGLLALAAVTGEASWARVAGGLLETVVADFADGDGFADTAASDADPALAAMGRAGDPADTAHPSGWSAATGALLTWASLTGSDRHRRVAEAGLGVVGALARSAPRFAGWGLAVAQAALDGPREAAVVGDGPAADRLHRTALAGTAPGLVVARGRADDEDPLPLLAGRPAGRSALGYLCRGQVCDAPTADHDAWARLVGARSDHG